MATYSSQVMIAHHLPEEIAIQAPTYISLRFLCPMNNVHLRLVYYEPQEISQLNKIVSLEKNDLSKNLLNV